MRSDLTTADASTYLSQLGLTLPPPLLDALVARVNAIGPCLEQYSLPDASLIRYYLAGLLAISSGGRRVTSQTATSGASQSYSHSSLSELTHQLRAALARLDTRGCTAGLIPAGPGPLAAQYVVGLHSCGGGG